MNRNRKQGYFLLRVFFKGVAIFAKDFSVHPARKISKNYATAHAFGGPDSPSLPSSSPNKGVPASVRK
ncbi:MAG: hypothetical protein ACXWT3_00020 [Methylococcaceae bacterium]